MIVIMTKFLLAFDGIETSLIILFKKTEED